MPLYGYIFQESSVKIWGLTPRQRLLRLLKVAGVTDIVEDLRSVPENSPVLLLRGDYLFDDRVLNYLVETPDILLKVPGSPTEVAVAAHVVSALAPQVRDLIAGSASAGTLAGVRIENLKTLSVSFQQRLLKVEAPFVLPVSARNRRNLERRLFDWSYKGVTDLITKWAWPRPAQWAVGLCVRCRLLPNHITVMGLALVILAALLFASGRYGWGLLAAWLMTFLDTVDGKLARVTVTSSRLGHYFDHVIDILHPPIWYLLWGLGLANRQFGVAGLPLSTLFGLIVIGYTAGRLVEGAFQTWLGKFGIFCWRPLDSYFRLITARRNPCLILLTVGTLLGHPDWGLFAVAVWTVATSLFLTVRLALAVYTRLVTGSLKSWFLDIDEMNAKQTLAMKLFTGRAPGSSGGHHEH